MAITLIADSGSTKTDWCVVERNGDRVVAHGVVKTTGINPVLQSDDDIRSILSGALEDAENVKEIYFYGAGCTPQQQQRMSELLHARFVGDVQVEVNSDLLAAARALCGKKPGIACILGTGANSCYYDGEQINGNIPPLGYILGDEGSGAVLGKHFLNALFKEELPSFLRNEFLAEMKMTYADVIERVYRKPMANRFLASLSPFILSHLDVDGVSELVVDNFRSFIRKNVVKYQRPDLPLNAVGSIAFFYENQLRQAAGEEQLVVGSVEKSPMDGLLRYHIG